MPLEKSDTLCERPNYVVFNTDDVPAVSDRFSLRKTQMNLGLNEAVISEKLFSLCCNLLKRPLSTNNQQLTQ